MNIDSFVSQVSPPFDKVLTTSLLTEFVALERRFALGDWEPATLDGGQFAEVASRIVYHIDSENMNRQKGLNPCLAYVEDDKNSNKHSFPKRREALHLCKVLRVIYKFRSQRGAIHIDPDYTANELDSTLVLSLSRWAMSDLLRIFWKADPSAVARLIREIIRYPVPAVFEVDGRSLVLRTDCSTQEEILLLLHNAGETGLSRAEIGKAAMRPDSTITNVLKTLCSPDKRQVVKRSDGQYVLTPNGTKRVQDELSEKLSLS